MRTSSVHGLGVFATDAIRKGATISVYQGARLGPQEVDARDWDNRLTYLFALSDGTVIDGADGGNGTRHLNHSCAPNCEALEVVDDQGVAHITFEALRDIAAGEELFLDYQLQTDPNDTMSYACFCGAMTCRGTMRAKSRKRPRSC